MTPLTDRDPVHLGEWELLARIAEGGMGQVYLARRDGCIAALKAIKEQLAWDDAHRTRFRHEVTALAAVDSPFVVRLVDADVDADTPWLVTEYEPATDLDVTIRRSGPLRRFHGLKFLAKLALGVEALHQAHVIHRDLKPTNVLVTDDGPRVIDLGIARTRRPSTTGTYGPLTEAWSSPEQLDANPDVSPATDVFNLGLVIGFALSGRHPFGRATTSRELAAMVVAMCHGRPDHLDVEEDVGALVLACFGPIDERPSAGEVSRALLSLARGVELNVAAGEYGTDHSPWAVPASLRDTSRGPTLETAATVGGEDAPDDRSGGPDRSRPRRPAEVGPGASPRCSIEDPQGRFIVLPATDGWNPLIGLDDDLAEALHDGGVEVQRGRTDVTFGLGPHRFVVPLGSGLPRVSDDQDLWDWLDEQVGRFSLMSSRADVGGRLIRLRRQPGLPSLYVSINPDVHGSRPHFVALEYARSRQLGNDLEQLRHHLEDQLGWDEAEEDDLADRFRAGVPLADLVLSFGRSPRTLCHRLERLGVIQPMSRASEADGLPSLAIG